MVASRQPDFDRLRAGLAEALALPDETARSLGVVAVIGGAIEDLGLRPVVVGGLAVQYWTHGAYATADIDLLLPDHAKLDSRFSALGFSRHGRHWSHPRGAFVEAPGSAPGEDERTVEVSTSSGATVLVLSPDDILIHRLHEFVATGARDAAIQAAWLLTQVPELDRDRVADRARQERLDEALEVLAQLAKRIEQGDRIESDELHAEARRLRAGLYDQRGR